MVTAAVRLWCTNYEVATAPTAFRTRIYPMARTLRNVAVALTWGHTLRQKWIKFYCDNLAMVNLWEGKSSMHLRIVSLLRTLFLTEAKKQLYCIPEHLPGKKQMLYPESNLLASLISHHRHSDCQHQPLGFQESFECSTARSHVSSTSIFHASHLQQWCKAIPQLLHRTWSVATPCRQTYVGLLCSSIKPKPHNPHHKGVSLSSRLSSSPSGV